MSAHKPRRFLRDGEKVLCACRQYHLVVARIAEVPVIECPEMIPGQFDLVNTRYMFGQVEGKTRVRVFPDYDGLLWVCGARKEEQREEEEERTDEPTRQGPTESA
jgi:hypothetical protein